MITKGFIQKLRSDFIKAGLKEFKVDLVNIIFPYFVLPQSMNQNLQDFALAMVTEDKSHYLFGVSDSLPEAYRPYWAFHEFVEYVGEPESPERCVRALERELSIVPNEIKPEYLLRRLTFFQNLVRYASGKPDEYAPKQVNKFQKSLSRLEELAKLSERIAKFQNRKLILF